MANTMLVPITSMDVSAGFRSYLRDGVVCLALECELVPKVVIKDRRSFVLSDVEYFEKLSAEAMIELFDVYGNPRVYLYKFEPHPNVDDSGRVCLGTADIPRFSPDGDSVPIKDFLWKVKDLLESPNLDNAFDVYWEEYNLLQLLDEGMYADKGLKEGVIV